jgi:hypothetical protein
MYHETNMLMLLAKSTEVMITFQGVKREIKKPMRYTMLYYGTVHFFMLVGL